MADIDVGQITEVLNDKADLDLGNVNDSGESKIISLVLQSLYPVGAIYIGVLTECPLKQLIPGSEWRLIESGMALWTGNGQIGNYDLVTTPQTAAHNVIAAGLPNITGSIEITGETGVWFQTGDGSGALSTRGSTQNVAAADSVGRTVREHGIAIDASKSSSVYGNSTTVQPPAYVVNVWRRTA